MNPGANNHFNEHHQMVFQVNEGSGFVKKPLSQFISSFPVNDGLQQQLSVNVPVNSSPQNDGAFISPSNSDSPHQFSPNGTEQGKKLKKKKSNQFMAQLEDSSTEFSPIACQHCRSLHKKCDRKLPNCQRCVQTNHLCFYPERRRKRNENEGDTTPTYDTPPTHQPTISNQAPPKKLKKEKSLGDLSSSFAFGNMGNLGQLAASLNLNGSLNDFTSKFSSLDSDTQMQLLNMASALPNSGTPFHSILGNLPTGLISAFTAAINPVSNSEITPIVTLPASSGQYQQTVKPITAFVLDIYFHTYSFGFPLVPKERMTALLDLVLLKQQQQQATSAEIHQHYGFQIKQFYERVAKQHWTSSNDMEKDLAVFFAILAATLQSAGGFVYQQYKNCANSSDLITSAGASVSVQSFESSFMDTSNNSQHNSEDDLFIQNLKHKWFTNSKNIVGKYFDDMEGMSIPIALTFLIYFLIGEGDLQRARMYTSMVESLCQKIWASMNCFGIGSRGFVNGAKPVVSGLVKHIGGNSIVSNIMFGLPALLVHRYLRPVELFLAEFEEPTNSLQRKLQNIGNKIRIDLTFIKNWEEIQDHELIELEKLIKFLHKYIDLLFSTMINKESMLYITSSLTFFDVVIDTLERAVTKNVDEILKFSAEVIEITKMPLFTFLPTVFINTVLKAIKMRLRYGKPTEGINSVNLKDDMAALKILSSKYPAVSKLWGDVSKEVESVMYFQSFAPSFLNSGIGDLQGAINNVTPFDFDENSNSFDIMALLNDNTTSQFGLGFDDELFNEIFNMSVQQDGNILEDTDSCESIFIDGEKLEIPSCVKPGSFLPILTRNLTKQKELMQQAASNHMETNPEDMRRLRNELIEELTQHIGSDENSKLLIQLFTKQYLNK